MKIRILLPALLIIVCLPASYSQDNSRGGNYVPQIGQQGKDVVWVPTPQVLVDTMLSMAKVNSNDFVIDLGSGDGRTVISAAKRGARALGVEYNPDMVALSRQNAGEAGVSGLTEFKQGDLFECDLSGATVITLFLLPDINLKLRPKLLDLKPGTRIVSNTFTMGDWEPDREVSIDENWSSWSTALLWIVPAKVEGKWKIGEDLLNLSQDFQMVKGTLTSGNKVNKLTNGKLRGDEIIFRIGNDLYRGNVIGDSITGVCRNDVEGHVEDFIAKKL